MEGPIGEWIRYYDSRVAKRPIVNVKKLSYRNNPILLKAALSKADDCFYEIRINYAPFIFALVTRKQYY